MRIISREIRKRKKVDKKVQHDKNKYVVLITGSSSGIGRAIAVFLHNKGCRVYGASRQNQNTNNFTYLQMDVTDTNSVNRAIDHIIKEEGRIDVLINSAGFCFAGPIEETSEEEVLAQFNTNFMGVFRLCKGVLPVMREKRCGKIINISSLAGLSSLPFQAFYSASKFALEGMTEALRMEVSEFGIHVVLIEPGNYNTAFTQNRTKVDVNEKSVYKETFKNALLAIENEEKNGPTPEKIARLIFKVIKDSNPKLRYKTGPLKERLFISLKGILPYNLYEHLMKKHYGLNRNNS